MNRALVIAAAAGAIAAALAGTARASCIPQTEEQQTARADVIFLGTALEGPTSTGKQRFRVEEYVKGSGPAVVAVSTGVVRNADGTGSVISVSVVASAGERWRVYASRRADDVLETSVCAGSTHIEAAAARSDAPPPREDSVGPSSAAVAALIAGGSALIGVGAVALRARRRPRDGA